MGPRGGMAAPDLVTLNATIAVRLADISASPHRALRSAAPYRHGRPQLPAALQLSGV
jgi:hypothetical protein